MKHNHDHDILLNLLVNDYGAKYNLDKTHLYIRCMFCGDSRSDKRARSLNIQIPTETTPRWLYICFRSSCRAKGYITPEFMRMLNFNSYEANVYLNKLNKSASKNKKYKDKQYRNIKNFPSPDNKLSLTKLKYINDRLGLKLSLKDLINLKINTSMDTLYKYNDIKFPNKKENYYRNLSDMGISFISTYNDYIIVRNTTNSDKIKRYTIVDIFENELESMDKFKSYSIPTQIDLLSDEPIELILSEGSFDILSIYFNIEKGHKNSFNKIFCSVSGSSFEKIITHFIRQYGLLNIVIKIYSDSNVGLDYYKSVYNNLKRYLINSEMYVYYNELYKDFGVSKDEIKISENYIY